jgi:hypothetical protein
MVVPLLALVPQQGVSLDFKSRQPLTRSFVLFFFIISRCVELFNMIVEFWVTQCDVARRPAIVVYHLVWDGNHSDNATIIDERWPTLIHWAIFNNGIMHVSRLVRRKWFAYPTSGVHQILRLFITRKQRLVDRDIIIICLIVIWYIFVIIRAFRVCMTRLGFLINISNALFIAISSILIAAIHFNITFRLFIILLLT